MPDDTHGIDPTKLKWMQEIAPRFAMSAANLDQMDQRRAGQQIIAQLEADKEGIRTALMSIEVSVRKEDFGDRSTMKILDGEGNAHNELDYVHHPNLMKEGMPRDQQELIREQEKKLEDLVAQLAGNPYYDPGEPPEFTEPVEPKLTEDMPVEDRERLQQEFRDAVEARRKEEKAWEDKVAVCNQHIAEDVYKPLVREGVFPEALVPDEYSDVLRLFEGAASAYDERLEEYSESLTEADILQEKFDLGFKIGKSVLKLASASSGLGSAVGGLTGDTDVSDGADLASDVFEYMDIAVTLGEGVAKAVITEKDMLNVGLAIADAIGATLDKAGGGDAGAIISRIVTNGARGVRAGRALSQDPPDYEAAFEQILESITSELEANDPDSDGGVMSDMATIIGTAGAAAIQAKKINQMRANGAPALAIISAMMDLADPIATEAGKALKVIPDDLEDGDGEGLDEDELAQQIMEGRLAKVKGGVSMDKLIADEFEADIKAAETLKASAEEAAEAERAEFEKHLAMGFPLATDDAEAAEIAEFERVNSIEYLIAMQKKNEATFKMCTTIAEKGVGFVAKLFPPAALVQACMTLALTIKDAVEKTQEMLIWRENVEDSRVAVSPVVDAMLNRSGLQTKQAMQANIQVALDAAKVVAEAMALSPAAPAAPVVKAVVETAEATMELADIGFTELQLANAWKIYEQARAVPTDRWLARKATRENPTLAKYAMAYAALEMNDAIAAEGMRRCGLNQQVLANPTTNVAKVVTYLETKYADDPVLLRAVPSGREWHPGQIELTAPSWMAFHAAALAKAELDRGGDVSGISAAMGRLDTAEADFAEALQDVRTRAAKTTKAEHAETPVVIDPIAHDRLSLALIQLRSKLDGYKPLKAGSGGVPHDSMAEYIDALRARSEQRSGAVAKVVRDASWLAKLLDKHPDEDE